MSYFSHPGRGRGITVGIDTAINVVLVLTGVTLEQLQSRTRRREVVTARALLVGLLRVPDQHIVDVLYPGRPNNRTSVASLRKTHRDLMDTNPIYHNIAKQAKKLYGNDNTI